jgi:hypothetical protein
VGNTGHLFRGNIGRKRYSKMILIYMIYDIIDDINLFMVILKIISHSLTRSMAKTSFEYALS